MTSLILVKQTKCWQYRILIIKPMEYQLDKTCSSFCFEYILKLREKVRENLVCCLMWGYSGNKKEV